MQNKMISDEDLVAYLDGEADPATIGRIEAGLRREADVRRRLDHLRLDVEALKDSFALLEPPVFTMPEAAPARGRAAAAAVPVWGTVAAACVALVVGFGAGHWQQGADAPKGWMAYVAAYQALYSPATLAAIDQPQEVLRSELARVSDAVGKDIDLAQLEGLADVTYKRGQVLSFKGRPLVQLAFATPTGVPIAFCIIEKKEATAPSDQIATLELEGLSAAQWTDGLHDYVIIGGQDTALIERLGGQLQAMQI
ncbi:hypothetical protein J7382_04420 [Shimia sp. R11_0]|uniref:anti-sigma factor family protein n=1 Tax=Shimia sp. R11_0 TaxID=2821096 RepID=UPI001ADD30B6|nr:hypothetical protein [Shimia sp. R11_0]MBO9476775.1 hypothetical protein [Shimia sp. R11_0]